MYKRQIVKLGLQEIQHTTNVGLRVLLEETGLADKQVTEYHLGFVVGPCINATGRLESGRIAVELFRETDVDKARAIARHLMQLNEERKEMTTQAVERLTEQLDPVSYTHLDVYKRQVQYLESQNKITRRYGFGYRKVE